MCRRRSRGLPSTSPVRPAGVARSAVVLPVTDGAALAWCGFVEGTQAAPWPVPRNAEGRAPCRPAPGTRVIPVRGGHAA